jgi:hypothetical protein
MDLAGDGRKLNAQQSGGGGSYVGQASRSQASARGYATPREAMNGWNRLLLPSKKDRITC